MREAENGEPSKELMWKLKVARIIYPLAGLALVVESYVADLFEFDMHVIFHVVIYSYVVLMNSLMNDTKDIVVNRQRTYWTSMEKKNVFVVLFCIGVV